MDGDIVLNHPIIIKYIFPSSQESNLDYKPSSFQIGHLMHFYKKNSFLRPCMGVLQTDGMLCQVPSVLYVGKR